MAKQRYSGVVAAAREVQQVQNRFLNDAGSFMAGYNKVVAKRKEREKTVQDSLARANQYMEKLDSNINLSGFSGDELKILKNASIEKKARFAQLSNELAQFPNTGSPEAQMRVDEMNEIQTWFSNVDLEQKKRLKSRADYAVDVKSNNISCAGQNDIPVLKAELVNNASFNSISDDGKFQWEVEGQPIGLDDGKSYFFNSADLFKFIDSEYDSAAKSKYAYTSTVLEQRANKFRGLLDDKNTIAGLLEEQSPLKPYFPESLINKFDEAYDANDETAMNEVRDEITNYFSTFIQDKSSASAKEIAARNPSSAPSGPQAPTGPFANLSVDSRALVKNFKDGAPSFRIRSGQTAYAFDAKGNRAINANGTINKKYQGPPAQYLIGSFSDGQFVRAEGVEAIKFGETGDFVRIAGLK